MKFLTGPGTFRGYKILLVLNVEECRIVKGVDDATLMISCKMTRINLCLSLSPVSTMYQQIFITSNPKKIVMKI